MEQDVKQAAWLADPTDYEETVITAISEQDFLKTLTEKQRDVYEKRIVGGQSLRAYAKEPGVDFSTVNAAKTSPSGDERSTENRNSRVVAAV